jgi:hypothetical protein
MRIADFRCVMFYSLKYINKLHGVTHQKTVKFIIIIHIISNVRCVYERLSIRCKFSEI